MLTVHLLFPTRNDDACVAAKEGISRAFEGRAQVLEADAVDEVLLKHPGTGKSLWIMVCPELADLELALKSVQEDGIARWPVVALSKGLSSSGMTVIGPDDWNGRLLAQVFRTALQHHDLLQENGRLRGDMMTIARRISHDLRTPLSGVFTTAELLKEILTEYSEDDAALTASLFDSTQAVLKLIEKVSQVAKASVETQPKQQVDMGQVAWAGRQSVERAAMDAGVRLQEPERWPSVQGVPPWLEVIWANLLSQAVQRSGKGGAVAMHWRDLPDAFEFSVTDQGPELKEDQRSALFWPFEKLHQSRSAKGLELPIVRRLVELQGGHCKCELATGGGLRFIFTLPKVDAENKLVA